VGWGGYPYVCAFVDLKIDGRIEEFWRPEEDANALLSFLLYY